MTMVLLLEASIAHALSGSGVYQTFLLSGCAIFLAGWWGARSWAGLFGAVLAMMLGTAAAYLFEKGLAQVVLSDLPPVFHPAVAIHFWTWSRLIERPREGLTPLLSALSIAAGAAVVWAAANTEIYGSSILAVRAMAAATLIVPLAMWLSGPVPAEHAMTILGRKKRPASRWRPAAVSLGMVAALSCLAAWSQTPADAVASRLFLWAESRRQIVEIDPSLHETPVFETGNGFGDTAMRDLPRRADIQTDDTVRFWVELPAGPEYRRATGRPLYLRSSAMAIFAGDGRLGPRRQGQWIYDSDDGPPDGSTRLEPARDESAGGPAIDYAVLIDRDEANAVPVMDGSRSLRLDGIYAFADGWYQLALPEGRERVKFRGSAFSVRWEDIRDAEGIEPGDAPAEYRQLPRTPLAQRVARLAADALPLGKPWPVRIDAVRLLLRDRCQYSLTFDNPRNLEPIENFLFDERRGHCELYAASATMLLRSIGVPARVAFGYTGGLSDPTRGLIAYRQSDSHAWTEIFIKDRGWVMFDPTPPGSGAARPPLANPKAAALAAFDPAAYADMGTGAIESESGGSRWAKWFGTAVAWVSERFIPLSALLALLGFVFLGRRGARGGAESVGEEDTREPEAWSMPSIGGRTRRGPNLLGDFLVACAARGHIKAPAQTLAEFQARLKAGGVCGSEIDGLIAYLYRVKYAGAERDATLETIFEEVIRLIAAGE